jgi:predicted transcriptional regulator
MPKKHNNENKKNSFFSLMNSYSEVLSKHLLDKETIFYAKDCLLPILNLKVLVVERSREELNDVDLVLLKLIEQGICSINSLVLLTGLASKLTSKHLNDLLGRSLVSFEENKFSLTEIGKESLIHGVPIRNVQRAFRYCAVSEKLLPRAAYELVYTELSQIRGSDGIRSVKRSQILEEKPVVKLSGMNLDSVKSKRELNITDEALRFEKVLDYTSGYLQTRLFILGEDKPQRALISFGRDFETYDLESILSMIQPINNRMLEQFEKRELSDLSFKMPLAKDQFGLPVVYVQDCDKKWLSTKLESGKQAILLCGTDKYPAKPVARGLHGHTVRYFLEKSDILDDVNLLRRFEKGCEDFIALPRNEKPFSKVSEYVVHHFANTEILKLIDLVEDYAIKRFQNWLPKDMEGEA